MNETGLNARMLRLLLRVGWFLPAFLLFSQALPAFFFALNKEAAFPVSAYLVVRYAVPRSRYLEAARYLSKADPRDGEALIAAAEANADGGARPDLVDRLLERGLAEDPASVRGWTLMSELKATEGDTSAAALALSIAIKCGPYDYWIAERRAKIGSELFDSLHADDKKAVLTQARLLWQTDSMKTEIPALVETPSGARLLTTAYAGDPRQIRAIDRWLADYRNQHPLSLQ